MELHAYSCDLQLLLKISIYLDLLKYGCHSFIAYARDGRNGSLWSSQHILCWGSEAEEELSNRRKYRWKICLLLYLLLPNSVQRCDDALVLSDVVHKSRYPARVNEPEKTQLHSHASECSASQVEQERAIVVAGLPEPNMIHMEWVVSTIKWRDIWDVLWDLPNFASRLGKWEHGVPRILKIVFLPHLP